MIKKYCHGKHGTKGEELCEECRALTEYALFRLEKCPFKVNKKFCSFCKIHCYKPDMREKIKDVMKWAGPRMIFTHPDIRFQTRLSDDKLQTEIKKRGKGESKCLIKNFLKLIGGNKKYVVYTVLLMVLGMLANIGITASVCWAVYFLIEGYEPLAYIYPR